jgi:hypothetical protein
MNKLVSLDNLCELSTRDKIFAAEAFLKEQPQVDIPVQHYFSQGVYAREITIPAGVRF